MRFAVGADMAPRTVEHGGRVVIVLARLLSEGKDERDIMATRGFDERRRNRIWQLQEEVLVVRPQLIGKERRQEQLGKTDDVAALRCSVRDHPAGDFDARPHVLAEHRTGLSRRDLDRTSHVRLLRLSQSFPVHGSVPPFRDCPMLRTPASPRPPRLLLGETVRLSGCGRAAKFRCGRSQSSCEGTRRRCPLRRSHEGSRLP